MDKQLVTQLVSGNIAVIRTDTIYGIVGSSRNPETVERIYRLKERDTHKPFIILISDSKQLDDFKVKITDHQRKIIDTHWPGPVSIIFSLQDAQPYEYLHRGTEALAFRLPDSDSLRSLIDQTGPLVAPSANPQGREPATTIAKAQAYFSHDVNYYLDGGEVFHTKPSTLISLVDGEVKVLRD